VDRYNVVLIQPPGYPHSLALMEVARLLDCSFRSLGRQSEIRFNQFDPGATNVVVGYHLVPDAGAALPNRYIVYQLEQLCGVPEWLRPDHLEILRGAEQVWEYSPQNLPFLAQHGIERSRLLPLGFHEKLQTIVPQTPRFDVLFYGSINRRRQEILSRLARRVRLKTLFGVYGDSRDQYIACSRIVLNVHYYESQLMEQVRLSYLLNNRCCVVSEDSPDNPYKDAVITAPYHDLVECCCRRLAGPSSPDLAAETGFEFFRRRKMVDYLSQILGKEP